MTPEPSCALADTFAGIARRLEAADDPRHTRQLVTTIAVDTVPGCDHASISLVGRRGGVTAVARTDQAAARISTIQHELNEGPCLDSIAEQAVYTIADLHAETRWPQFRRRAAEETAIASIVAFQLFTSAETSGALNLYARQPHAFTEHSRAVGAILAAHAAIAMAAAREHENAENLEQALHHSRQIGKAIGLLMARQDLDEEQALNVLVDASQRLNRKLHDLASVIVDARGLPRPPGAPQR